MRTFPRASTTAWPTPSARSPWTRSSRPNPAIPACRWARPMSPPCCSRSFLKFDPADPAWPDRDRFVLSAGHGSMLLYALLYLLGYAAMTIERDQALPPARLDDAGPSGKLRHARASRPPPARSARASPTRSAWRSRNAHLAAVFGDDIVDHHTYVLASDGDLMEGISQEAIALAGHLEAQQADRAVRRQRHLHRRPAVARRLGRSGEALRGRRLGAARVDGHDPEAIAAALEKAQTSDRPTLIACKTTIGFGAPTKAGKSSVARLAARRRRDQRRAREARLDRSRRSKCRPTCSAHGAPPASARKAARTRLGASGSPRCRAEQRAEFERRMQRRARRRRSPPRCAR